MTGLSDDKPLTHVERVEKFVAETRMGRGETTGYESTLLGSLRNYAMLLDDALDDVQRLHNEKMAFFEAKIELERELAEAQANAAGWHQATMTAGTLMGLPGGLGAQEFAQAVQDREQRLTAEVMELRQAARAAPSAERERAALHACEGLDTTDLAGNERGWLSEVVRSAARVECDLNDALRACCPGNGDDDQPVRCQSYEASEQANPCPPGCCVMADAKDVRATLEAIEREDGPSSSVAESEAVARAREVIKDAHLYHEGSNMLVMARALVASTVSSAMGDKK